MVKGNEVEILRWNDDACRFADVPLFRLAEEDESEEMEYSKISSAPPDPTREHSWLPSNALDDYDETDRIDNDDDETDV